MKRRIFCLWLAVNMLIAAIIFFPWIQPRETISGFVGRKMWLDGSPPWLWDVLFWVECFIDWMHRDRSHCYWTAVEEQQMRKVLYENPRV